MSAIREDDDADVQTGLETAQPSRTAYISPRELALQALDESRAAEFTQETGHKVEVPPLEAATGDEDVNQDDIAAELARQQLEGKLPHQTTLKPVEEVRRPARLDEEAPGDDADDLQRRVQEELIDDLTAKKVKVKINGVEQEVPLADVVRTFQKSESADRRLSEATRLLEEAKAERERVAAERAGRTTDSAATRTTEAASDTGPAEMARRITSAFFSGDEETAQQLLADALAGQPSARTQITGTNIEEITAQVTQHLEEKNALTAFQRDYPKLWTTPRYARWANDLISEKESTGMSRADAIREAGAELAQELGMKPEGAGRQRTEETATVRAERLSRKEQATERLPVRSVTAPAATETEPEQTYSATIAEMRAARPGALIGS